MLLRLFFGAVFSLAALLELLRRKRYDMIFIVTNPPALAGAAWLYYKITGVRYLYLVHDLYPDIAVAMGKLKAESMPVRAFRRLQRLWLTDAGRVVVLGRCMKRHLLNIYRLKSDVVTVIPSWGATEVIGHANTTNDFRRNLEFSGAVALYAGNFSEYSKIELFLAAAYLLRNRPDLLFVLIGDGSQRAAIEREVAEMQLANVRLLPRVPREMMGQMLAGCDIALLSLDERMLGLGVPSKLYTILAAGRAVLAVVPEGSEVALVLEEERCGINAANGSPPQIAAELTELIDAKDRLRTFGMNAKRAFIEKYAIENACVQFRSQMSQCVALPTVTN